MKRENPLLIPAAVLLCTAVVMGSDMPGAAPTITTGGQGIVVPEPNLLTQPQLSPQPLEHGRDCAPDEATIDIEILTDDDPSETVWEVSDFYVGTILCSGGPYDQPNTLYSERCCIDYKDCVNFTIYDSSGDGIFAPGGYAVYYDGELIYSCMGQGWCCTSDEVEQIGWSCIPSPPSACCLNQVCVDNLLETECDALGGDWYEWEFCPDFVCPEYPVDFLVTAPYTGEICCTCGAGFDCDLRWTEDHEYQVIIPAAGLWNFNTCLLAGFDTYIFLGASLCSGDLGENDDACGLQSEIIVYLEPGTYFCTIEGYGGCGDYIFDIHEEFPPTGACCSGPDCLGTMTEYECDALGGDWYPGEDCDTFECPWTCPESMLDIAILTDPYPSETTWEVTVHGTSEVICSGGPYADDYTLYEAHCCIDYDACVDFTIYDSWGDGIYAPGGYRVILDGEVIYVCMGEGWYGYEESIDNFGGGCVWPEGACCVWNADTEEFDCVATNTEPECDVMDGHWYEGFTCPEWDCPWIEPPPPPVFAPYTSLVMDTCGAGDDCDLRSTEDHEWYVVIRHAGLWSFNTCLLPQLDTYIFLGTTQCSEDLGYNDDACGLQSEIIVYLEPGSYFCTIEGYNTCGEYIFDVRLCGDLDNDGGVDVDDFCIFLDAYGTCEGDANYEDACDFDGDGCITLVDYQTWMEYYRYANG
jgi:hypothetical protein